MTATDRDAFGRAAAGPTGRGVYDRPSAAETTFPRLLDDLAGRYGDRQVALQEKRYGIWQPIGWSAYRHRVRAFAHGLDLLGVRPGDIVAVLGDNRPEWLITELAAQAIGAAVVGIYPTSVGEEVVHILTHAEIKVVVAEDQEQVDKLLLLREQLPLVEAVVFYDPHGLESYDDPLLREFIAVEAAGERDLEVRPDWYDERVAAGHPDDIAVICTTSGTTSRPKLAMLSHANLLSMGHQLMVLDPVDVDDRYVSFLPFAWIGEQMLTLAAGLQVGFSVSFPEDAATTKADMREIGPDVMFSPPRIWESMLSDVQVRLGEAGWLKRTVFGWGFAVGGRVAERRVRGEGAGAWLGLQHTIAELVALKPLREQLGLRRIERCYTGGAPLGPDVFRFFHAIGVNLKQIYGQTEICGIAVTHTDDDVKFNTVGRPIPGTELKIADDGEILLRSAAVFQGYYRNEEATSEAFMADGWLKTGDAGYLDDDGHLVVIDRAKDVLHTADGTMFSPAFIENKLKFSPFVEEAVAFGGADRDDPGAAVAERDEITAIVTIDMATVGTWAEHQHLGYTTYTDLAGKPEIYELIANEVSRANQDLPEAIQVRRFVLLHKQFDPDDDEITRTRKVRRGVINERYAPIITALAAGTEQVTITSLVTYQDGSTAERELVLRIERVPATPPDAGSKRRLQWSTT
jgi:long-chain acyl-CoA synthetase